MAIPCICANPACNKIFKAFPYEIRNGRKFCCASCMAAVNGPKLRTLVEVICNNTLCKKPFFTKPSDIKRGGGKYCSPACVFPNMPSRDVALRFWEKVTICIHGIDCVFCCWDWQGGKNRQGYGVISVKIDRVWKDIGSHRVAWEILNQQSLPSSLHALHHCDRPSCSNGMHIYPGTPWRNAHDAIDRGRHVNPQPLRGEDRPQAKVTEADVITMRKMWAEGYKLKEIQTMFPYLGVPAIHAIVTRRNWKHIP